MEERLIDILLSMALMEPVGLMDLMITRWPNDMFEINTIGDVEFTFEDAVSYLLDYSSTYVWGPDEEPLELKFMTVSGISFEA